MVVPPYPQPIFFNGGFFFLGPSNGGKKIAFPLGIFKELEACFNFYMLICVVPESQNSPRFFVGKKRVGKEMGDGVLVGWRFLSQR